MPKNDMGLFDILTQCFDRTDIGKSSFSVFRRIPASGDSPESLIIERLLTPQQQDEVRIAVEKDYNLSDLPARQAAYRGNRPLPKHTQMIPMRALYKIASDTGLIIEDSFYDKSGTLVTKVRNYDSAECGVSLNEAMFKLPVGRRVYFPKTDAEAVKLISTFSISNFGF